MIFEDASGKRWRLIIAAFWLLAVLITFGMSVLVLSATLTPHAEHPQRFPEAFHAEKNSVLHLSTAQAAQFTEDETDDFGVERAKAGTEVYRVEPGHDGEKFMVSQIGSDIPEKTLVLTFDDGPDPRWTPQILDILDANNIKATFFVTGKNAIRHSDLLQEITSRGHTIGNHTYTHPDIFSLSHWRLTSELNMTERAIENATGKRTMLFRSPYFIQTKFSDETKLPALAHVSSLGYAIVGANIDSRDWEQEDAKGILSSIRSEIKNPLSHIILMHDAGGNRQITVDALAEIIPLLQEDGYRFSSMEEAMGIDQESLMPSVSLAESALAKLSYAFTVTADRIWLVIKWLFFITTAIATLRVVVIGSLVVFSLFRKESWREVAEPAGEDLVSVVIPAYNEEKTIEKTLSTLLKSTYQHLEILVVDDGSTDTTAELVAQMSRGDHRIHIIRKDNGGKSTALNRGFIEAHGEIVVTIDADTLIEPTAIQAIIAPFRDHRITAACGNVEVGNVQNAVTGFQALEYITTQNFDRRAFDALNCITVVPGATSAWRRLEVIHAGGFTSDTLAEDADLTFTLLQQGAKIVYVPEARSHTEAPLKLSCLTKQRFRWVYGTMQCLAKHTSALFRGTLGWVALPNILLFHILFPLLAPIGDIALVFSLVGHEISDMIMWYLLFIYIDLFGSLLAFTLERKPRKIMWLILLQRFCYRQFMYIILYKSIVAALRGKHHSWNRVERTGTVLSPA